MSSNYNPPATQPGSTTGTAAQSTTGAFTFGSASTGAGDANKPAVASLFSGNVQTQGKPEGQLLGTNYSTANSGFPLTFGALQTTSVPFGTPASGTSSFTSFPATTQVANLPSSTSTAPQTSSLGLGMPFGSQSMTSGFRPSVPPSTGSDLGTLRIPSTLGNMGATPATSATSSSSGLRFTTPSLSITTGTGVNFTTPVVTSSAPEFPTGISGTTTVTGATNFNITGTAQSVSSSGTPATANPTPASSAQGNFSFSGAPTQTAQSTGLSFGLTSMATPTPASAATEFNLGTPASSVTSAAAVSTAAPTSAPQTSLGTATNVTSSTATTSQPAGLNFCQLEEAINKWTLELEEQEKAFVNQATQVNAWDRLLIANGEKIVTLNQEVERVKLEQQQLEHELDYVVGQQRELQDCLVPLEKELATVSATDPEREYTYRLAENLDTQLKQMSEDLKEIIEHLNEANRSQDSSDPIVQIGKILNAHMNSLQWLDQRTAVLQTKIQQIDQMHQNFRQEHERSFNLAYN